MRDSIKREANKLIKEKNPNLFSGNRDKFFGFINDYTKWYVVALAVLFIFFILHLINIPLLNIIPIKEVSVKTLINSRTTNIVTMISVTFAIIGFLIANLAIKESFTYNILFKKSGFFPIAFIALSLIVCFIALSTFGDGLSIDYQSNALLVGSYLIFVVVFLIGYLFTKLVRFTNQKYILNLVQRELISESKRNLLKVGRTIVSSREVQKLGLYQYSMAFLRNMTRGDFALPPDHNIISDIRINKLRKKIEAIEGRNKIFVNNIFLDREIANNEDVFFFVDEADYPVLKQELRKLNNCIITSKKSEDTFTEAKEYVFQKLDENIKSNDNKLVGSYLDMLSEVYELQQKFQI